MKTSRPLSLSFKSLCFLSDFLFFCNFFSRFQNSHSLSRLILSFSFSLSLSLNSLFLFLFLIIFRFSTFSLSLLIERYVIDKDSLSSDFPTADFIKKVLGSVHSLNGDYLSIPEDTGSCGYLFYEILVDCLSSFHIFNFFFNFSMLGASEAPLQVTLSVCLSVVLYACLSETLSFPIHGKSLYYS